MSAAQPYDGESSDRQHRRPPSDTESSDRQHRRMRDAYSAYVEEPGPAITPDAVYDDPTDAHWRMEIAPGELIEEITDAAPGVVRIAAGAWLRSASWTLDSGARSGRKLLLALTDPERAGELVEEVATDIAEATHVVSGIAQSVAGGMPLTQALREAGSSLTGRLPETLKPEVNDDPGSLRDRGQDLLRRSRDVWSTEQAHPAYSRILDELAPDEARILLLLLRGGPQPSVDVRTGGPVGVVSSSMVASGLSMIGPRAGVRYLDSVPRYLNNLFRLGLVWFSREQIEDPMEYQVVEAQPDVLEAMHSVRFAKVVRRSIHLTPFGEDFCRACLVEESETADLPEHADPDD